jgi:outer membrane protein TolC
VRTKELCGPPSAERVVVRGLRRSGGLVVNRIQLVPVLVVALGALVLTPTPVAAQDAPVVKMSLAECLRAAIDHNLDLALAQKDPRIAENNVALAESEFDSALTATASYDDSSSDTLSSATTTQPPNPPASASGTSTDSDERKNLSVAWGQKVSFGAEYSVTYGWFRGSSSGFSQTGALPFLEDTSQSGENLTFGYKMPLLRDFGKEVNTAQIILARSARAMSDQDLRGQANATLKEVEGAYWDLLAAIRALDVAKESLKLAQDLLNLNRKKVEVGTLAPIEIVQAEAGVASREENVILAETAVSNAEDNLRRLLAVPQGDPLWESRIAPTDSPEFTARPVDLDAALSQALVTRPEIVQARQGVEDQRLNERTAKNAMRHRLDLDLLAAPNQGEFDQSTNSGISVTQSRSETDGLGWNWGATLTYAYPIGNRAAKAGYGIAMINREKSEITLQNVEQTIRVDVRTAVRNVESGVKRVQAAQSNTVLQRKTLEAEQKKFENGMSTSFEVLRIQTDLLNAQVSLIRAVLDYNKALADLERAKGTLLEARGFTLDAVQE